VGWHDRIAWAAGFYEGEGSVTLVAGRLTVQIKNNDREPLERFRAAVEAGTIYGPYSYPGGRLSRKPFWVFVAGGGAALNIVRAIAPWLSQRRLGQILDALARIDGPSGSEFDLAYSWVRELREGGKSR
jgi:hypothetical protein